jgi:N-acetylneuraminate synthase
MSVGRVNYGPVKAEMPSKYLRRSLWWAKTLPEGSIVKEGDLVTARPDEGLHASLMTQVIGSKLECDVTAGTPVDKGDVII